MVSTLAGYRRVKYIYIYIMCVLMLLCTDVADIETVCIGVYVE